MHGITVERTIEILANSEGQKIAVIGDIMLDKFFWGTVNRISPEAPVPVIELQYESSHLGGAANVASNLKSLGLTPILCGVLGNDNSGEEFLNLCKNADLITDGIILDKDRQTTVKTRIIANNQHVARVDREVNSVISPDLQSRFLTYLKSINNLRGIIFEDYNKGMLPKEFIEAIIKYANENEIIVTVAQHAFGFTLNSKENVKQAGLQLLEKLKCKNVLITLGSDGMVLFQDNGNIFSVPTRARQVADVSGAGDTAIATYTASVAGGASVVEAASIANFASGTVCEKPGVVSIEIQDLLATIKRNGNS
jgi:bifunctional ADP-heptose synthase (sugar kinase/adenylyltransferase)